MSRMERSRAFLPRLLPAREAAYYLGISQSKLRQLNIPRRVLDGKRLYEISDLDDYADSLSYEGESGWPGVSNSADEVFGCGT